MLTVLLAALVWTVASLVVAAACSVLAHGVRLSAARQAEHLARVEPAATAASDGAPAAQPAHETDVARVLPASFAPRRAADDMVRLP